MSRIVSSTGAGSARTTIIWPTSPSSPALLNGAPGGMDDYGFGGGGGSPPIWAASPRLLQSRLGDEMDDQQREQEA